MAIDFLVANLWAALSLWIVLYVSDYVLTLAAARRYQGGVNQHMVYEKGYELTPYYQEDIAKLRRLSPRFLRALALSVLGVGLLWFLAVRWATFPAAFEFLIGSFLLLELAVHFRHFTNLLLFGYAKRSQGVKGRIEYARWLSLRISALQFGEFGAFYLLACLLLPRWFFVGGTFACLVTAFKHWRWSVKERSQGPAPGKQEP